MSDVAALYIGGATKEGGGEMCDGVSRKEGTQRSSPPPRVFSEVTPSGNVKT